MSMIIAKSEIAAGAYIPTSAVVGALGFDDDMMHVSLVDGRIISVPIVWFPRLRDASREQLENYEISPAGFGIHWPDIDEDLSVAGLLAGVDPAGI
jgi:hypothetical protein